MPRATAVRATGPCRMIAPAYKRIAKQYKGRAVFVKVNVNNNQQTSQARRVRSMPTFQFFLKGKQTVRARALSAWRCCVLSYPHRRQKPARSVPRPVPQHEFAGADERQLMEITDKLVRKATALNQEINATVVRARANCIRSGQRMHLQILARNGTSLALLECHGAARVVPYQDCS